MFELFALALFQFGVLTSSPETASQHNPQTYNAVDGDEPIGGNGWGDGQVSNFDEPIGGNGWGDGQIGGNGWGDGQ